MNSAREVGPVPVDRTVAMRLPVGSRSGNLVGIVLLCAALSFNAIALAPELRIGRVPPNDAVLHLALSERLVDSVRRSEPFLDPWVSEWGLGYPVWRSYQILPHVIAGGVLVATERWTDHATAFAALQYALLVLVPLSAYVGARLFGLAPLGAGLASCLIFTPTSLGQLGWFGLTYGATTWRGGGLFTQLVAVHMLLLCLGATARALDTGRFRPLASVLLAATALSHIVFGYVAFVSAALLAAVGPRGERARRFVRLATVVVPALFLLAWFVVPLLLAPGTANHSRWEAQHKWDSYGAAYVLGELIFGSFLDGGRWPVLSLLVLGGSLLAVAGLRDALPRRLLALSAIWLALFFGRPTWGHLLVLAGVPADLPLHRLQAAFEIPAILMAAWGLQRLLDGALMRNRVLALALGGVLCAGVAVLWVDRAHYLRDNAQWGETNLGKYAAEQSDVDRALDSARAILAERPGRVSAGKAATWGGRFKVGSLQLYGFATRAHLDQASFLYHSMSLMSDIMVLRDESDAADDALFAIRAVIAPDDLAAPAHWHLRGVFGRFTVYEASPEGYFGLVDVAARYTGPTHAFLDENSAWLRSPHKRAGVVVALGGGGAELPAVDGWFPPLTADLQRPRGEVLEETKAGEVYTARVHMARPAYALLKITWDPYLAATVDGAPVPVLRVTPGFAAVRVQPGTHQVTVRYAPGPLRPVLLVSGLLLFVLSSVVLSRPAPARAQQSWADRLAALGARLATPRVRWAVALLLLGLLALRPLFRGQLIEGHDIYAYPPRVVEMDRTLSGGGFPPVWAPDLGAGYGHPLFVFSPPLLYLAALSFRALGFGLTDSLQFALAVLHLLGAAAVYRLGRTEHCSRPACVASAAAWLFAPYTALDLFVRSAFAESAAVALAPIALLGVVRAVDRPSMSRVAAGAVVTALVSLAHNGVALLLYPALAAVVFARASAGYPVLRRMAAGGVAMAGGLGLSAFFWLPAMTENALVKTDLLRAGFMHWSDHAVAPWQLLWSPWGFGLSVRGTDDGMSFAIGPVHLVLGIMGLIVAWHAGCGARRTAVALAAVAAGGAFLATTWAAPVWSRVEALQYLQHPWRALFLAGLSLPLLSVFAFDGLGPRAAIGALAVLVLANLPHTAVKGYQVLPDESSSPMAIAQRGISTTTRGEYEPRWVAETPAYTPYRLTARDGPMDVVPVSLAAGHQDFAVRVPEERTAEAATFYYPGWTVRIDGRETGVAVAPVRGTMLFRVPAGVHRVTLDLEPTPLRRRALMISIVSAAVLALLGLWSVVGRRRGLGGLPASLPPWLIAVGVLGGCWQGTPATPADDVEVASKRARAAEASGDAATALRLWADVVRAAAALNDQRTAGLAWDQLVRLGSVGDENLMARGLDNFYGRRNPQAAATAFRTLVERNPMNYGATYQLAAALDANGEPEEARPHWERVEAMAARAGDRDAAERARQRLEQPPATPDSAALMKLGLDALYQRRDVAVAVESFSKILEQNPAHYGAHYQLAAALDAAGQRQEARVWWEKMLTMAEAVNDQVTADAARERLETKP